MLSLLSQAPNGGRFVLRLSGKYEEIVWMMKNDVKQYIIFLQSVLVLFRNISHYSWIPIGKYCVLIVFLSWPRAHVFGANRQQNTGLWWIVFLSDFPFIIGYPLLVFFSIYHRIPSGGVSLSPTFEACSCRSFLYLFENNVFWEKNSAQQTFSMSC
jgi:hypothetical protein